jgi:hypothetical protein
VTAVLVLTLQSLWASRCKMDIALEMSSGVARHQEQRDRRPFDVDIGRSKSCSPLWEATQKLVGALLIY